MKLEAFVWKRAKRQPDPGSIKRLPDQRIVVPQRAKVDEDSAITLHLFDEGDAGRSIELTPTQALRLADWLVSTAEDRA